MRRFFPILLTLTLIAGMAALFAQSPAELRRRREAVREVAMRAENGEADALYHLSTLYERGYDSIPQDTILAMDLLRRSAEQGYPPAANLLGYRLIAGELTEKNPDEGFVWIEKAAEEGDPKALNNIGYLLLYGDSLQRNPEKAAYWLQRAADGGNVSAISMLGDLYRDGHGVARDSIRAESLYRLAFDKGLADAGYKLAAINAEITDSLPAPALLCEGLYYFNRTAPSIGVRYFRELADSLKIGERNMTPDIRAAAKALLGDALSRGYGSGYDYELSNRYFFESAQEGNPSAAFVISELLEILPDALSSLLQPSDSPDLSSADYWREVAAQKGVNNAADAMRRLRECPPVPSPATSEIITD